MADSRMGCFLTAIRKEAADLFCWPRSLFGDWSLFFLPNLVSENYSSGKKEVGRQARQGMASMTRYLPDTYLPCPPRQVGIQVVVCVAE